uniref:[RNA-polymerase]-subunit kinase n=1 Tax=Oryza barthii TaxID=65489 RepID=A0A0D3FT59_9ORYZ
MAQILVGLRSCHERDVLHRDIKGANLLTDGDGHAQDRRLRPRHLLRRRKAAAAHQPHCHALVPPTELLLGATEYGVAIDLCSTGCMPASSPSFSPASPSCILAQPNQDRAAAQDLQAYWVKAKLPDVTLFKPQWPYRRKIAETFRDFSPPALDLLDTLLAIEPSDRATGAPRHRRRSPRQ